MEVWRRAWRCVLVLHTFPSKWENIVEMGGHTEASPQHTHHLWAGALLTEEEALMYTFCNHLPLLEQSFGTRPEIHKSNTAFIWCKQCPLHPAPALTVYLPQCRVAITQWSPNLFYCFGWTTRNCFRSLESSCGSEDKENKAVLRSVTDVVTLEGGWEDSTLLEQ